MRHADVHDDQIEFMLRPALQGLAPVVRKAQRVAFRREDTLEKGAYIFFVIGDEYSGRVHVHL